MKISLIPLLLILAPLAGAQVLDGSGLPDPAYPNLYGWYDASDGCNGFGQPADGAPVTAWMDRSIQQRDLTRVSSDPARQPTWRLNATANAVPAVEFDGDDFIWAANNSEFGPLGGAKTILVVCEVDSLDNASYIFDSSSGSGRNALLTGQQATPDQWQIWTGAGLAGATGTPIDRDVFKVHSLVIDDLNQEHWIGGISQYTGTVGAQSLNGFLLGARYTTSDGLIGHIAEVLVYAEELSASDRGDLEGYLDAKYNGGGTTPPTLDVTNLVAGQAATVSVSSCSPLGDVTVAYSLHGSGPTGTPFGDAMLSPPWKLLPRLTADANGDASISQNIPGNAASVAVWIHALDWDSATFTNALAMTIQ